MIVGGESSGGVEHDSAYALSLDPDVPVPSCLRTICDFPHPTYYPIGAVFEDGLPTICGGENDDSVYKECYKYNYTTNIWGNGNTGSVPSGLKHHAASHTGLIMG